MKDKEFLRWLKERLIYVYKENDNVDFVQKLNGIINNYPEEKVSEPAFYETIKIDWAEMYQYVKDDIIASRDEDDGIEPDKYQILDWFKIYDYYYLCDYCGLRAEYSFDRFDVLEADRNFTEYIKSLKD